VRIVSLLKILPHDGAERRVSLSIGGLRRRQRERVVSSYRRQSQPVPCPCVRPRGFAPRRSRTAVRTAPLCEPLIALAFALSTYIQVLLAAWKMIDHSQERRAVRRFPELSNIPPCRSCQHRNDGMLKSTLRWAWQLPGVCHDDHDERRGDVRFGAEQDEMSSHYCRDIDFEI